jgi:hypothetical protein
MYQNPIRPRIHPTTGINERKKENTLPTNTVPKAVPNLRFLIPRIPVARCSKIAPIKNVMIN